MARETRQLVDSYYIGLGFLTVFYVLLTLIGLAAIVLRATVDANIPQEGSNVFVYIVKHYLPVGARGVVCVGLIAGVMSTADAFLHSAGLALAHDVIQPSMVQKIDALKLARRLTLILGLIALSTALYYKVLPRDLYGGLDLSRGLNFITEVVALVFTIPLVAGIMGLKTDARSFFVSAICTTVVFLFCHTCLNHAWIIPAAIVTNLLSFFGTHYFQYHGFVVINRAPEQNIECLWQPRQKNIRHKIARLFPTPQKLLRYSQDRLDKYGSNPTLFALFIALSAMIPFFMHSYAEPSLYNWLLAIRGMGALFCVGLLLKAYWPQQLLRYFPLYYHFTLLYCLPFVATFLFLLENGNVEWLINVALTIMFLIVLVDWMSFVLLSGLGVVLGFSFYQLAIGPINLQLDFSTGYLLVYTCFFATLIALIFSRRREQHLEAKLREIADHYHTTRPAGAYAHPATIRIATMIDHQVQESIARYSLPVAATDHAQQPDAFHTATDCLHYFFSTALAVIQQGDQMMRQLVEEIKNSYITPQKSLLSIQACVTAILEAYHTRHPQDMQADLTEDYRIYTSFNHLQYVIIYVLRFLQAHHLGDDVCLWITAPPRHPHEAARPGVIALVAS